MNGQETNPMLENAFPQCLDGIDLGRCGIAQEQADGEQEIFTIDLSLSPAMAYENLDQIQDNGKAIEAITTVLNFISLMQAKEPCENCGEWHEAIADNGVVAGLYQGLRAISQYSSFLAHETKRGIAEPEEEQTAEESR